MVDNFVPAVDGHLAGDDDRPSFVSVLNNLKQITDARAYTVHRISAVLRKTVCSTADTYLATEISDGKHTLCVVRAKVIVQR
jgi:hypothetical protein